MCKTNVRINGGFVGLRFGATTHQQRERDEATIPRESIIKSSISLKINFHNRPFGLFDKNFS
jgi:hypothetical protein